MVIILVLFVVAVIAQLIVRHRFEQNLAMSSLAPRQRREIHRAVKRGTAVRHPELAAARSRVGRQLGSVARTRTA